MWWNGEKPLFEDIEDGFLGVRRPKIPLDLSLHQTRQALNLKVPPQRAHPQLKRSQVLMGTLC